MTENYNMKFQQATTGTYETLTHLFIYLLKVISVFVFETNFCFM